MRKGKVRVGIISANWGVHAHLPAWRSLKDDIDVVGICTSRRETAEAAAEQYGFRRAFWDHREMAADPEIDLIDVGTRPPLRHEMVTAALDNGKHVYCGIPFAPNYALAKDMTDRLAAAGTVGAVDAFVQAVPAFVHMKELIKEGYVGEMFGFRACVAQPLFTARQINVPGYAWFADAKNAASAMRNNGSHFLHLLVHLFGDIQSIVSDQSLRLKKWPTDTGIIEPEVPDHAYAILKFASGLSGELASIWSMPDGPGYRLEVWGSHGRLVACAPVFPHAFDTQLFGGKGAGIGEFTEQKIEIPERLKRLVRSDFHADTPQPAVFPMASIFSSMLDEMEGKGKAAPGFPQALHVQRVVEAAARSSDERRWVDVVEIG